VGRTNQKALPDRPKSLSLERARVRTTLRRRLLVWFDAHRRDLPWRRDRNPYRIWVSEVMLQQTQVAAVIPYYQRFLERFPDIESLATAPSEDVMALWSGLGYYSRARNLHRCAQLVVAEHGGVFPNDPALLIELPGIGRSTAAAIAAFAYGARAAILDGNVKRVFARVFGIDGYPGLKPIEDRLWQRAVALLPQQEMGSYTQGLMDLGATLCIRGKPACSRCPLAHRCVALASDRVEELPVRKAKKIVPEKHTGMLIVADHKHVLLQQRPDSGIWGGLLSLPEVDTLVADDADPSVRERWAAGVANMIRQFGEPDTYQALPAFSHTFTHFKLHINPYRVTLSRRLQFAGETGHVWLAVDKLADAPLPAPVKKLLLAMFAA